MAKNINKDLFDEAMYKNDQYFRELKTDEDIYKEFAKFSELDKQYVYILGRNNK